MLPTPPEDRRSCGAWGGESEVNAVDYSFRGAVLGDYRPSNGGNQPVFSMSAKSPMHSSRLQGRFLRNNKSFRSHGTELVQASMARAKFVFTMGLCTNFVPPSRERWHFRIS